MRIWNDIQHPPVNPAPQRLDRIAYSVAEKHDVSLPELKNGCREHHLVDARQEIACKMHFQHGMSYTDIGKYLDRHHTTIMNYINWRPQ